MDSVRIAKVDSLLQSEISDIITRKIKDPRIGFFSIISVDVSKDLHVAKIFISIYGDEESKKKTLDGLISASGFIHNELRKRLKIKFIPEIVFKIDPSIEYSVHISKIIEELKEEGL
ncbi:MAG: 30S ribosome-binding factor RbfA [Nitrospirota bacterium]